MKDRVNIIVDRPIGFVDSYGNKYPINYGYIPGIFAADGEEQDAYILGCDVPIQKFEGYVIAIIHRRNDVENKWVVSDGRKYSEKYISDKILFIERYFDFYIELLV